MTDSAQAPRACFLDAYAMDIMVALKRAWPHGQKAVTEPLGAAAFQEAQTLARFARYRTLLSSWPLLLEH